MDALLVVSPSKVIEAARTGSYPAIQALSRNPLKSVPDAHRSEVVELFCAHIRKTPIGSRKHHDRIRRCFIGLSFLLKAPDALSVPDVVDTWPAMTKWFTHFSQELAQGRQGPQDALHAYMDILHFLASDGKMLPHVLATPDAIKFATVTWLEADVDVLPAYPSTAIAVAQLLEHAPTPIITHISSSDVDVPAVARRLVHPLRVALAASPPPSREFFEAYVWLLHGFACAPLDVVAPFLPALLSAGAVRCVARALVRFSRHDVHKDAPDGIIDHGFRILYQLLQMGTGIPWVAQSVRHGLLDALVNIAPRLHIYGKGLQETCLALVKKLLPRYFLFRPVIRAVGRALERLEDDPNIALVQSRAFADSWAYLKDFAEHCVMFRTSWPLRECGNCAEQGHRSIFRRCARCREQHYCSVACQAAHWEKEHKEHCVRWLVPAVQLSGLVSFHEQQAHVFWIWYHTEPLAASITALRLAPDSSPQRNQYLSSLCVVLMCSVSPWELRIRRLDKREREAMLGDEDFCVFMESIVQLGEQETRGRTYMSYDALAQAEPTMVDYVLDRIPVEYGGRGIHLVGETC